MKIVIIDNYDSFVYNLSHAIKELGAEVTVKRNDQFRLEELEEFDKILLSPGPGVPEEAGLLLDVIRRYAGKKPILGVCLGEQAIGEVYGGKLTNLDEVFHGIQSPVSLTATDYLFEGLPSTVQVGRYHSWVVDRKDFPECLEVTAVRKKDTSWHSVTAHSMCEAYSFIRNPFSPPKGNRYWATGYTINKENPIFSLIKLRYTI